MATNTSKKVTKRAKTTATKAKASVKKAAKPKIAYALSLKKKVVQAVKKGMTHAEASKAYKVGVHSIPNWVKKHV